MAKKRLTYTTKEAAEVLGWTVRQLYWQSEKGNAPKPIARNRFSRKQITDFANTGTWEEWRETTSQCESTPEDAKPTGPTNTGPTSK